MLALSLTLNLPLRVPLAVGVNTTEIVQAPLAAKLVPQVVEDTAKSPVVEASRLFRVVERLLVKVNVVAALVVPTCWLA